MSATPNTDRDSVEAEWTRILAEHGVDSQRINQLIASLQSHPRLISGAVSDEEVRAHVSETIDQLPLTEYGIVEDATQIVKNDLREALEAGLDGELKGPVCATQTTSPIPWPDEPILIDEPLSTDGRTPNVADTSPAAETDDSAGLTEPDDTEDLDSVVQTLRDYLEETDREIEDIEAALERLKRQHSE